MKWSFEGKWIARGFCFAVLLMCIVSIISYQNTINLIESSNKVKHTHEVLKNLIDVFATLTDAESGRRGYFLYRDEEELKRYNIAIQSIAPKIEMLRQLIGYNPNQQRQLLILESLIAQRLALFKQSIDLVHKSKSAISYQDTVFSQSNSKGDEIRKIIAQMQSEEEQLLKIRIGQSQSSIYYTNLIKIICTFLCFGIVFGLYALLHRQMVKRQRSEIIQRTLAQEKELSEHKVRFLSMISHEFRTPLSIILGSAQLLAESSQQWTEKKQKNLDRIQSSAKLMTKLLTDILTLTRAETGKMECNPKIIELESFCLNLVEDIQFCSETQHSIKFISQAQCTHANLDEKLLYSILSNLLSNALKYSPHGGNIDFILSCSPEAAIFQIKDEGIGIPLEDRQALYEPFYRSKNVEHIVGTGLGLAVVKKCLDIHRGQISVESIPGIGTTFTVTIPQGAL